MVRATRPRIGATRQIIRWFDVRVARYWRTRCAHLLIGVATGFAPAIAVAGASKPVQSQTTLQAERSEFRGFLPITKFYSTPSPLPPGKPGELIRSEEFDEYELPEGVSSLRILYHSRSADGGDVAASGVVLLPDQSPPPGGWPVIAWAHSFTGTARRCAPSLMRNLYQGPLLSMYVKLGYAVVAADYAGLGTNFRNASVDMKSNATDVLYSIPAARAAAPHLGRRWVTIGEADGGLAALAVAELEGDTRDPDYLGSIAVSGIADAKGRYEQIVRENPPGPLVFLVYGIQTLYPKFEASQVLTERALPLYHQTETACTLTSSDSEPTANQMLRPGWEDNPPVQQFFARNSIGGKPTSRPLLIINSDLDPVVRTGLTRQVVARMCKQGDVVRFHEYNGAELARVLGDSVRDQLTWIQARFAGRPAPNNCH